ncbi:MAG: putative IMPACT (imprinted ancient) family translation regulator [Oceanicoccus sp.]|jgi:putative IMPACT (imprinted ancient) family translation regulator
MKEKQIGMAFSDENEPKEEWTQLHKLITDRGSRYSVTAIKVHNQKELKAALAKLKSNKKFAKATHNSYALRVQKDTQIFEAKNDDGETGAGMVILRQLRKGNWVNCLVIVTRWYGGTKLHADRFKHVQDASRAILQAL